jgi:hypothetical protein
MVVDEFGGDQRLQQFTAPDRPRRGTSALIPAAERRSDRIPALAYEAEQVTR